jgi:subtilisin family serine protease
MRLTEGSKNISIGIIDGPVDLEHPALKNSKIRTVSGSQLESCKKSTSLACMHGTFISAILVGARNTESMGICPKCEIILRPIFNEDWRQENNNDNIDHIPTSTPEELSNAIVEVVDAGAKLINLSIGISDSSIVLYESLHQAYEYALQKNVLILSAAGNQRSLGYCPGLFPPWVIPIAACDENAKVSTLSNIGPSIGKRGFLAPGENIVSALAGGSYVKMSGTSFAAPFVAGGVALLWSLFPDASYVDMSRAILQLPSNYQTSYRRSLIPPVFEAGSARTYLEHIFNQ